MKRTVLALVASLTIGWFPSPLTAQNQWEQQVRDQLSGSERLLQDSGFQLVESLRMGRLRRQAMENVVLDFEAGIQYFVVGACDNDCSDLNMELVDASGRIITEDMKKDALPILVHAPEMAGRYTVRVSMAACSSEPCFYGVVTYGRGSGLTVAAGGARVERGTLAKGDQQLSDGEYVDDFTFEGVPGQTARIDLRSTAFDTYLIVQDPSGEQTDNDDASERETTRSHVELAMTSGHYRIRVTSFEPGETGGYELSIDLGGSKDRVAGGPRIETGELAEGDQTISNGEYMDIYTFQGRTGQQVVLDLRSQDFDPYLIFRGPEDQSAENDDHEGDAHRSLLAMTLEADGDYRVGVTSYRPGETGRYVLRMDIDGAGVGARPVAGGSRREQGTLASGDRTLRSGEFVDSYTFQAVPGQQATVDLRSDDFDTYLIVIDPKGEQTENDDEGGTTRSLVQLTVTEPGEYRVLVTSFQPDETGAYQLDIQVGGAAQSVATAGSGQRDVSALQLGQTVTGQLEPGDGQLERGEYRDMYVFDGQAGQTVSIQMTSSEIDTYLGLLLPNDENIGNDDYEGSQQHSRIDLTLRESGRYRVMATSYGAGETGSYQLTLSGAAQRPAERVAAQPARPAPAGAGTGRIFGVFAGISDYGGRASNLPYTADDAVRVRNAMIQGAGMDPSNGVLLVDAQATKSGIRGAMQTLAGRMGPNDTFVFFYSGHGGRRPRPDNDFQAADPDGLDETLEFVDAGVTDDEFNDWIGELNAGRVLLLLDACFSGGFSKDVISRPGRMGMFSSEEDVTSAVAAKFRAGGYLAIFLADAIADRLADSDSDGQISAIELSQYIHERYRADLKSADPGEYVRTGGPQLGFQHLVVDRGSIGPYDILFR